MIETDSGSSRAWTSTSSASGRSVGGDHVSPAASKRLSVVNTRSARFAGLRVIQR